MQTRYNIDTKYIVCVCRSVLWLSDAHFLLEFQGTFFGFKECLLFFEKQVTTGYIYIVTYGYIFVNNFIKKI